MPALTRSDICTNETKSLGWISPEGRFHPLDVGQEHWQWAEKYLTEKGTPFNNDPNSTLMWDGWVRAVTPMVYEGRGIGHSPPIDGVILDILLAAARFGCVVTDSRYPDTVLVDTPTQGSHATSHTYKLGDFVRLLGGRKAEETFFGILNQNRQAHVSLRSRTIRLAYENTAIRKSLLPLLSHSKI